ncbi:cupin domain-containing protein [Roseomonas sp. M0104]|uniref:Cupin domain-containing protein n=1 Tax=Teichococcus coralli TaxID=2545983 RepID=A0A845BA93_9PROT|nr:cupin domain-containing protein [Pseudoroseomonas coralli]MXP63695.1 cupin domain-containing protein [Pseudoroseomonas coralli]
MSPSNPGRPEAFEEPLRCRPPAIATVQIDNAEMRATRWDFPPGAETGWHRHGYRYIVVPLSAGQMLLELPGGETMEAELGSGASYERPPGAEHNVVNAGSEPFSFVEIELKGFPG